MIETNEMKKILSMVVDRTAQGEIEWREGQEGEFSVSFPQSTLVINKLRAKDGGLFAVLSALNALGDRVGHLHTAVNPEVQTLLFKLYNDVSNKARRVDETFNDILQGLGGSKNS